MGFKEVKKDTNSIKEFDKRLFELHGMENYLDFVRKKEKDTNSTKELSYIEYLLEKILLEVERAKRIDFEHEIALIEWEPNKYYLIDFSCWWKRYPIKIWTKKEYEEYANNRAGIKLY